jgi:hypothetical protein
VGAGPTSGDDDHDHHDHHDDHGTDRTDHDHGVDTMSAS